ncbi:MAG TPA: hypothetical protein VG056_10665 [Pirellulales bacterium]|nr:hypothetical protein [Pirellulales bacterium]
MNGLLSRLPDLSKFAFVINLRTVRTLGIDVRTEMLSVADDVIERTFRNAAIDGAK